MPRATLFTPYNRKATLLLRKAIGESDFEGARAALQEGADPTFSRLNEFGQGTSLHLAAKRGDVKIAALVLKALTDFGPTEFGPDDAVNRDNHSQRTPLFLALKHPQMVKFLLQHGADPNLVNNRAHPTRTPLEAALLRDDPAIVTLLLNNGADAFGPRNEIYSILRYVKSKCRGLMLQHGRDEMTRLFAAPQFPVDEMVVVAGSPWPTAKLIYLAHAGQFEELYNPKRWWGRDAGQAISMRQALWNAIEGAGSSREKKLARAWGIPQFQVSLDHEAKAFRESVCRLENHHAGSFLKHPPLPIEKLLSTEGTASRLLVALQNTGKIEEIFTSVHWTPETLPLAPKIYEALTPEWQDKISLAALLDARPDAVKTTAPPPPAWSAEIAKRGGTGAPGRIKRPRNGEWERH